MPILTKMPSITRRHYYRIYYDALQIADIFHTTTRFNIHSNLVSILTDLELTTLHIFWANSLKGNQPHLEFDDRFG